MVSPLLFIVYLAVGLVAVVLGTMLALISMPLALLMMIALFTALSVLPVMVGIRMTAEKHGFQPIGTYGGLSMHSLVYGIFEGVGFIILSAIAFGVFYVVAPDLVNEAIEMLSPDQAQTQRILVNPEPVEAPELNPRIIIAAMALATIISVGLRGAILPALAGGSIGRDPNGRAHTPFAGFCKFFISSFIITTLSFFLVAIGTVSLPIVAYMIGQEDALEAVLLGFINVEQASFGWGEFLIYVYFYIFWMWTYAIQAAGALLMHARLENRFVLEQAAHEPEDQMSIQNIRDLRQGRMK
jgi:hypothetical protein